MWNKAEDIKPKNAETVIAWSIKWTHPMCGYWNGDKFYLHPNVDYDYEQPTHWMYFDSTSCLIGG